jgi:hypothetical protein
MNASRPASSGASQETSVARSSSAFVVLKRRSSFGHSSATVARSGGVFRYVQVRQERVGALAHQLGRAAHEHDLAVAEEGQRARLVEDRRELDARAVDVDHVGASDRGQRGEGLAAQEGLVARDHVAGRGLALRQLRAQAQRVDAGRLLVAVVVLAAPLGHAARLNDGSDATTAAADG